MKIEINIYLINIVDCLPQLCSLFVFFPLVSRVNWLAQMKIFTSKFHKRLLIVDIRVSIDLG